MYAYIKGTLTKITPKYIVLENNNIGYLIIVSNPYNFVLNQEYTIYTYQNVKEDLIELYGFLKEDERELFLKLISVSGIGPKSALSILASGSVNEICMAIETRNDAYLKKFPGIGPKASQQIILDLKGKVSFDKTELSLFNDDGKLKDVVDALVALGYKEKDAQKVVSKLDSSLSTGLLVKEALKQLVK